MKYIVSILATILLVLTITCRFLYSEITTLKKENAELQLKNDGLIESIRKHNNAQKIASETITKIREKIKSKDDCYNRDIDDNIIGWVRGTTN